MLRNAQPEGQRSIAIDRLHLVLDSAVQWYQRDAREACPFRLKDQYQAFSILLIMYTLLFLQAIAGHGGASDAEQSLHGDSKTNG